MAWVMLAMLTPTSAESMPTMEDNLSSKVGGRPFRVGRNWPFKYRIRKIRAGSRRRFTLTISTCVTVPTGSWISAGWATATGCTDCCAAGVGGGLPERQDTRTTTAANNGKWDKSRNCCHTTPKPLLRSVRNRSSAPADLLVYG